MTVFAGVGCTPIAVDGTTAEAVDFQAGATFGIEQTWFGINAPSKSEYGLRQVTIDEWTAGDTATLSWSQKSRVETDESKAAREAAAQMPVGEATQIPDPVFADIVAAGTVTTDALGNAERILLPSYWPEGEYDVSGEENSVLWLSRQQYDELVATRTSHVAVGLFDSTLQNLINFGETVSSALAKLQGELAASEETTNRDITLLTADEAWGSTTLTINDAPVTVRTVTAESALARYDILANPENPLILKVAIKPLSLGFGMLSTLSVVKSLAGYDITSITY